MIPINQASGITDKKALVRCDLDVPIREGQVQDTFRLDHMLPTLNFLIDQGVFLVLMGHIGRPEGKVVEKLSTKQLIPYFDEKLGEGTFELLENLRFDPREKKNDGGFAKELSEKADFYVNECFSTCHRKHTSITAVPRLLPAYAGLRLTEEMLTLGKVMANPKRPLVVIIGGAKLESKKPAVKKFLELADSVLVGGKIAVDWDERAVEKLEIAEDFAEGKLDIGPKAIRKFSEIIKTAATVVWAGPMGVTEKEGFDIGTREVAQAVAASSAFSIVGGGDTISALTKLGFLEKFRFISTGGGAMLDYFICGNLPGLEVLGYHG